MKVHVVTFARNFEWEQHFRIINLWDVQFGEMVGLQQLTLYVGVCSMSNIISFGRHEIGTRCRDVCVCAVAFAKTWNRIIRAWPLSIFRASIFRTLWWQDVWCAPLEGDGDGRGSSSLFSASRSMSDRNTQEQLSEIFLPIKQPCWFISSQRFVLLTAWAGTCRRCRWENV